MLVNGLSKWNPYFPLELGATVNKSFLNCKGKRKKGKHNIDPLIWVQVWFRVWYSFIHGFLIQYSRCLLLHCPTRGRIIIIHPWFGGEEYDHFRFLGKDSILKWDRLVLLGMSFWPIEEKNPWDLIFFLAVEGILASYLYHSCWST